jgi:hypothetical protein
MDDGSRVVAPTVTVKARLGWNGRRHARNLRGAHIAVRRHWRRKSSGLNIQRRSLYHDLARGLSLQFSSIAGHCATLGGSVEERIGWLGRRVQSVQWRQTDQIVRPRAVLFQFRVVEMSQMGPIYYCSL